MRISVLLIFIVNGFAWSQADTSYIEEIPRDKTIQLHTTFKDLRFSVREGGNEEVLFRNHNWATGFYFKWNLAELFVAFPTAAFDNKTIGSDRAFGTGFGLNFYPEKWHLNYNFKYIQGFDSFKEVRSDGLKTLTKNNFFLFNRLNIHYLQDNRFSLRAALRFNDRQLKSAGSFLYAIPITYHYATVSERYDGALENYHRVALGAMAGYGYTHVVKGWAISLISKGGVDLRRSSFRSMSQWEIVPSYNIIATTVYNCDRYFIGLSYNNYPEWRGNEDLEIKITNWKMRLYAGKRFY